MAPRRADDWRPAAAVTKKIKKGRGAPPALALEPNPDILRELGGRKPPGQLLVGFAAETDNVEQNAEKKLRDKNLDVIVANDVLKTGSGFGTDTNSVVILDRKGTRLELPTMPKSVVAGRILDVLAGLLRQ